MTPSQCRAARALLEWTQENLEQRSGVAKKTIADFERGTQIPYPKTIREIELALEAAGVQFIAENGGGAGVRLKEAAPRLVRRRISRFERMASLAISYRGKEYRVSLSTDILDDIDRTNHPSDAAFERSADAHLNLILVRAANAIDAGRADRDGNVLLTANPDFPETGPTARRK